MTVFGDYARFYDTLYQEKDYKLECDFIKVLWGRHARRPIRTVLDLGCGTGGHVLPLVQCGYMVTGVDRSAEMLAIARQKAQAIGVKANWLEGDVRNVRTGQTYDTVLSMFAVMGYQVSNDDLAAAFQTARCHLEPGGLFVFDVWFGPAVLAERPTDRIKVIDQGKVRLIRLAQPCFNLMQHTVMVNYTLLHLQGDRLLSQVNEAHLMRFCFPQEVVYFLEQAGFCLQRFCPFLRPDDEMTESHFNLTVVAEAV